MVDELRNRAVAWRLLADALASEVSPTLVEEMSRQGLLGQLDERAESAEIRRLERENRLDELGQEFARLFKGPAPAVQPYGSIHHPDERLGSMLWGDTTVSVGRFILEHGGGFEGKNYNGIPDHVSHELEFFSFLLEKEASARRAGDNSQAEQWASLQRRFYKRFLKKWVPSFCEKVAQTTTQDFFYAVSRLIVDMLKEENARLK
jgi:TorA maturation chaperone TorD